MNERTEDSVFHYIYMLIYMLGDGFLSSVKSVLTAAAQILTAPVRAIAREAGWDGKEKLRTALKHMLESADMVSSFRSDVKRAGAELKRAVKEPTRFGALLARYIRKAFSNHNKLLKTALNIALPLIAVVALALTVGYWHSATFALEVTLDDTEIGYIDDESVFTEAQRLIEQRLGAGTLAFGGEDKTEVTRPTLNAKLKLGLVSIDRLNDAQTICDRVIENSAAALTNACGIYIDGDFIAAVKNESDAKAVFYGIIEPYEKEAETGGYVVAFAEDIDYVQGLYSDSGDIIIDAAALSELLSGDRQVKSEYTVTQDDTFSAIAADHAMTEERLAELNPDTDPDKLREGDTLIVEKAGKYVRIQKTVTSTAYQTVKFDTIKTKDKTKYTGYEKVTRKGVDGLNRVVTTNVYIDDELISSEDEVTVVRAPVDELKTVGGKSYYGGADVGSASSYGFLWPAPSCHYISSPYGYRRSGFHKGVDLCRADGGANGTTIIASMSGTVEFAGWSNIGYGYMVLINHGNGYKTRYAHMLSGSMCVSAGEHVYAGQPIGRVGSTGNSTGPHLHFEVIYYGDAKNPMNYLK